MVKRKTYFGSVGPLLYDDEEPIDDHDGDFSGEDRAAVRTEGSMRASGTDDHPDSLVQKATHDSLSSTVDTLQDDLDSVDAYAMNHGDEHLPSGADPLPTKVVTVVTSVDFAAESVTTEDVTVIDDDAT